MRVAIAVNNVAMLTPTWTTIHLIDAFLRAGHEVRVIESLEIDVTPEEPKDPITDGKTGQ